jgi:hypothetical protein
MASHDAENKLREFIDRYGIEGFVTLFFTNYLYELVLHFLHSKGKGDSDTSRLYYAFKGKVYTPEETEKFEKELRYECSKRARAVVNSLKELGLLTKFTDKTIEDPKVVSLLQENLESILRDISEV